MARGGRGGCAPQEGRRAMTDEVQELPLFPLNVVLFPGMAIPLHIFEERYKLMIGQCLERGQPFGVVLIASGAEVGAPAVPRTVGTTARIQHVEQLDDGRMNIIVRGQRRFRILKLTQAAPYVAGNVAWLEDEPCDTAALAELVEETRRVFLECLTLRLTLTEQWVSRRDLPEDVGELSFAVAAAVGGSLHERQELLEMTSIEARLREERAVLQRERLRLRKQLAQKLRRQEMRGGCALAVF